MISSLRLSRYRTSGIERAGPTSTRRNHFPLLTGSKRSCFSRRSGSGSEPFTWLIAPAPSPVPLPFLRVRCRRAYSAKGGVGSEPSCDECPSGSRTPTAAATNITSCECGPGRVLNTTTGECEVRTGRLFRAF